MYGAALTQATYWKNTAYQYFVNCNFKFRGTTSYDSFHHQRITQDPYAPPENIVDVFMHDNYYILAEAKSWAVY